ncbi:MAG: hypothetical protein L6R40_003452 [Gallowayella cf. fulva]|nr:MAG: hypothetical protein L6R40_003452 [Xanthomendoza cf. fulva]
MWNRILGKASDVERKPSKADGQHKTDTQPSTPRRSHSSKSTPSSRKAPGGEGINPTSTSYSSVPPAATSIASSYATASNHPIDETYLPSGLVRNASLADQIPRSSTADASRLTSLGSSSRSLQGKEDPERMESKQPRKERRSTRERDDDRRESKGSRDHKRRNSGKGKERAMSTDEAAYITSQKSDDLPTTPVGRSGSSSYAPHAGQNNHDYGPGYIAAQSHVQSSHVQDQFPGQFPAQSAAPYRPPLAANEGGPGLAAEYYGDAGQSVVDQPGVRTHSPSLIVGAEPHLQAASAVAVPPPEPSASGGTGAAASFFDGTFSAASDIEGRQSQKPTQTNGSSISNYSSTAPPTSAYTTSGARPTSQQASSAPGVHTLGAAAAGAAAGYYMNNHPSRPTRPNQESSSTPGHQKPASSSSHQQHSEMHGSYISSPSTNRPSAKPGKHSSQPSNTPLYAAGAAGVAAAAYHHNHHSPAKHSSHLQHHNGGSMAQQHHHRHHGPFSKFVDFFKDPDGVAQFEEYTEYIGVCRHCFDPHSSSRDAPRKHHYRRRRSNEKFGSTVRISKDSRYSSSDNESRRRKKNKSWLEAGIAGYGLAKVGKSLFAQDDDSHDSHRVRHGKVTKSHRRRSSSSSEGKSRKSYGIASRSSGTLSHRSRSGQRAETGITRDGNLYRKDSHGNLHTSTTEAHTSRHRSRLRSRDRRSNVSNVALGAALGSSVIASTARRRSRSPKKAFIKRKSADNEASAELASTLKLNESDHHDGRDPSRSSPDSKHRHGHRKEKKRRGFFTFSNGSSSSSISSEAAFRINHERKTSRSTKTKQKGKESREAEAALLGLGAAALAFNQSQRSQRKGELIAVKEKGKQRAGGHGFVGKRSSSSSEEDQWESASDDDYSSADSELAYGASLHRRSQESLSSDSSGLDKWSWRWGRQKQPKQGGRDDRRQSSRFDNVDPVSATAAMTTGANETRPNTQKQDSRMASTSSIPLQLVYPMPTSDPTQFDVARHDSAALPYQPLTNSRPDPVPIQHPQPVAPVSSAVYTTQAPYPHSYSAPTAPSGMTEYSHPSATGNHNTVYEEPRNGPPGAFPTGHEYFQSYAKESTKSNPRRRDSSPDTHTPEFTSSMAKPRRRRSLKDDASSVRFDLTKEQEDKDRRDERRRRREEDQRRERLERRESEKNRASDLDPPSRWDIAVEEPIITSRHDSPEQSAGKETWAAPAAAGVVAAAMEATVALQSSSKDRSENSKLRDLRERDTEATFKQRPLSNGNTSSGDGRGRTPQKKPMSVWQAAANVKRSSSHTEYAAYFTPTELLSKSAGVKETAGGANADNDITVHQVPNMITIEPSEPRGVSPSRAYSFPISAEDLEHGKKPLPWAVPKLNLVEPTPPTSRAGSVAGSRSPRSRSPLSKEVSQIPLEPLESVVAPDQSADPPVHVEYAVIEPKEHGTELADSPVSDNNILDAVPGISSLKKKKKESRKWQSQVGYSDDLDFAATVAAGLQDTGFNPSIVIDDPSFHKRDSPPGSEDGEYRRGLSNTMTEFVPESPRRKSPPHGFVEELPERPMPGSFEEVQELRTQPKPSKGNLRRTTDSNDRKRGPEELTDPSDNADVKPRIYSTEIDAFKAEDVTNAAVDPVGHRSFRQRKSADRDAANNDGTEPSDNADVKPNVYSTEVDAFKTEDITNAAVESVGSIPYERRDNNPQEAANENTTEPSDNARVKPHVYVAEPESLESEDVRNVAIDPMSAAARDGTAGPRALPTTEYATDKASSVAASGQSQSRKNSKSDKKSKRRSVGFDDNTSVISSPATFVSTQDSSSSSKRGRKGGIFGMFSKSTEDLSESKGQQQTPVEASLEDFEEPKERKKKSKGRKASRPDEETSAVTAESLASSQPEAQDDWDTPKKSKRGIEKRRSSGDPGRITQDLPGQVIAPASPGHDPFSTPGEMLTNLEDKKPAHRTKQADPDVGLKEMTEPSISHDNQQPSFLRDRPEQPPLPDIPDASGDPGGQLNHDRRVVAEKDLRMSEGRSVFPATADDNPKRPSFDLQSDGRSVSYSTPSPTAIPLRPLRFGRRPSSPGLARSLPSTPQPFVAADPAVTPKRRERPHSTEFKSNEFRPMWLLEKYGSRQEAVPQETYPSLPSSHSTSRASSVHESDNLYSTEALDLAMDETSRRRLMQEPRGLSINTSHRADETELLDSQQATPTAASFHSTAKEGNATVHDGPIETLSATKAPKPELIDVFPPASEYVDPLEDPPQDQRLLHRIEDLFPQRRASSPSRYGAGVAKAKSEGSEASGSSSPSSSKQAKEGLISLVKDAALGAFIGGSAAALLKSTSQHDEHLEHLSTKSDIEEPSGDEIELMPNTIDKVPARPTAEEARLMQERDAQDAVDSWFAFPKPKMSKSGKKGGKRGKSYDEPQSTFMTNPSPQFEGADAEIQGEPKGDKQARPLLDDAALTAEPTEAMIMPQYQIPEGEPGAVPIDENYQAALTSRRDSRSKKKKNKKRSPDQWENTSIEPEKLLEEQRPDLKEIGGRSSSQSGTFALATGTLQRDEAPPELTAVEHSFTSTKKTEKGDQKNQPPSIVELSSDQPQEETPAAQSASEEALENLDVSVQQPDMPSVRDVEKGERKQSIVEEAPYEFPAPEEAKTEIPPDSSHPMEESLARNINVESQSGIALTDLSHVKSHEERAVEATPSPAETSSGPGEVLPPKQGSRQSDAELQVFPGAIPLPPGDDLDLLEALPESPVLQPLDAPSAAKEDDVDKRESFSREAFEYNVLDDQTINASNNVAALPAVLSKAISDLALPESVAAAQIVKSTEDAPNADSVSFPSKKGKKNKIPQAPAFEIGSPTQELQSTASGSESKKADEDVIGEEGQSFTVATPAVDPSGTLEENVETSQKQPADDWSNLTTQKGGKGKKGRKGKLVEMATEQNDLDLVETEEAPTTSHKVEDISVQAIPPAELSALAFDISSEERQGMDATNTSTSRPEPINMVEESIIRSIEREDEWPMAKKQNKGKKGKNVQFKNLGMDEPEEPQAAASPEIPLAATNTASEIQGMLHDQDHQASEISGKDKDLHGGQNVIVSSTKEPIITSDQALEVKGITPLESVPTHSHESQVLEDSSPVPALKETLLGPLGAQRPSLDERAMSGESNLASSNTAIASTRTAAEVQEVLAETKPENLSMALEDTSGDPEKATETDEFAWAPSKKKKKGKKSRSVRDTVSADVMEPEDQQSGALIEIENSTPTSVLENESLKDFSSKTAKKGKKNKRKGPSRSASDFGEESPVQDIPPIIEEPPIEEMSIKDNAPSIRGKIDELPSMKMPMSLEATRPTVHPIGHSEREIDFITGEPDTTNEVDNGNMMGRSHMPEITQTSKEEMGISAKASSSFDQDDDLQRTGQPFPPQPTPSESPQKDSSSTAIAEKELTDIEPAEIAIAEDKSSSPMPRDQSEQVGDDVSRVLDNRAGPVVESSFDIPVKSKEDEAKAKDAKALDWIDEPVSTLPADQEEEVGPGPGQLREDVVASDELSIAAAQTMTAQANEPPATNEEDNKKPKELEASAQKDEILASAAEPSTGILVDPEPVLDPDVGQPARPDIEDKGTMGAETPLLSKEGKKKDQIVKAGLWKDENPEASTKSLEDPQEVAEAESEPSSKPTVKDKPVVIEEIPLPKNDRQNLKGLEAIEGEEDKPTIEPTTEPTAELQQTNLSLTELETIDESSDRPAVDLAEVDDEQPTPKKGKKKGKKSKFIAFNDDEPTIVAEHDLQQQGIAPSENGAIGEQRIAIAADIGEQPLSKKGKKKGKKTKFMDFDNELSVPPSRDEAHHESQKAAQPDVVDDQPLDISAHIGVEKATVFPEEQASSKKGKKKGKKSKFVDFEEPPILPSQGETDQQDQNATSVEAVAEQSNNLEAVGEVGGASMAPDEQSGSKTGKRKGKKSKLVDWVEEPFVPISPGEMNRPKDAAIDLESAQPDGDDPSITPQDPTKAEVAIVTQQDQPTSKKVKKKSKKSRFADSDEEPSIASVQYETEPRPGINMPELAQNNPDVQNSADSDLIESDAFVAALQKSKKDQKSAEKAKALLRDEESASGIRESPITDANELQRDLVNPLDQPTFGAEVETSGDMNETTPANELEQQLGTPLIEAKGLQAELPTVPKIIDNATNLSYAPLEPRHEIVPDGSSLSSARHETVAGSRPGISGEAQPAPSSRTITGDHDISIKPENNFADLVDLPSAPYEDPPLNIVEPTPSGVPVPEASPLLMQADDVHMGSLLAPSTEIGLRDAEANIPSTQSDETIIHRSPLSENVANELKYSNITPSTPTDIELAQEPISSLPDIPADQKLDLPTSAPLDAATSSLVLIEAGAVDITEEVTTLGGEETEMEKKGENAKGWTDEVSTPIQDMDTTIDETTFGVSMPVDQLSIRPSTPPEQLPETFAPSSKREKKQSEIQNRPVSFGDEPSRSTTPAEPDLEVTDSNQVLKESWMPADQDVGQVAGDFSSLGKRGKKSKKGKKARPLVDEPFESTAAENLDLGLAEQTEEPSLPADGDEAIDELVSLSKKDKKRSKMSISEASFNEEASANMRPVGLDLNQERDVPGQKTDKSPVTDGTSVLGAADEVSSLGKKDKKKSKRAKAFAFDEEPSESVATADQDLEKDAASGESLVPKTVSIAEPEEEFIATKKKGKKSKKSKKSFVFDEEPSESTTMAELGSEKDLVDREPSVPIEQSMAKTIEELPTTSKRDKKSRKNGKTAALGDEPSQSEMPIDVLDDEPDKRLPACAKPSTTEVDDDFASLSKKDRKKVKKDKKTLSLNADPTDDIMPAEPALPGEQGVDDVAEKLLSVSTKEKKKAKKAKKSSAWEDEVAGADVIEAPAPFDNQSQENVLSVLSAPRTDQTQEADTLEPSGVFSPPPIDPIDASEGRPNTLAIPSRSMSLEPGEATILPEAEKSDLVVGSKKSKKNKKEAKKSQPLDWGEDDGVAKPSQPEVATFTKNAVAPLPEIQEGQVLDNITEQPDITAALPSSYETEQAPMIVPTVSTPFVEQGLAPRHELPASISPVDAAASTEAPPSSQAAERFVGTKAVDAEPNAELLISQPSLAAGDTIQEASVPSVQEVVSNNEDDFTAFAPTTKIKKSKKGKKQAIDWEDDTLPPPETAQNPIKAADDVDLASRPELTAWPTEVRLNQATMAAEPREQPASAVSMVDDPIAAGERSLADEPLGPPPVEDDRSDYFDTAPNRHLPSQPQPSEHDRVVDPTVGDAQRMTEGFAVQDNFPAITAEEEAGQPATTTDQYPAPNANTESTETLEGFASVKNDKKSKRKKKKKLADDIMWEFPPMAPALVEGSIPMESKWPSDPSRGDRLHIQPSSSSAKEQRNLADTNIIDPEELTRGHAMEQPPAIPADSHPQAGVQAEPSISQVPVTNEAAADEWGTSTKKSKKAKKTNKGKATAKIGEPETDPERLASEIEGVEDRPQRSASPYAGVDEAIAGAAVMGGAVAVAQELEQLESTKDRKQKDSRPESSSWSEPAGEAQTPAETLTQDHSHGVQGRVTTPERRSPILAWHQNISSSQSPKRSELYEVEDDRPRSAASTRRTRSSDDDRGQSVLPERRSPIEAWHQYSTPRPSPQQSELYEYDQREARTSPLQPSTTAINRDSAVHVPDSPVVSHQSPARRPMRDSGYPDTEASPVVGFGFDDQASPTAATGSFKQDHGHGFVGTNPLQVSGQGKPDYDDVRGEETRRTGSRSASNRESQYEDPNLPPRHSIKQITSFEDLREPSPVSSTTKDRSSVLFQSSPSTREEQGNREPQELPQGPGSSDLHGQGQSAQAAERCLTPEREDNSAMVNARAESLAALSGMRGPRYDQAQPSLFGGPVGISSDSTSPETPIDHDSLNRRRLKTITEYSPEDSPLHKKNRDLTDVGVSAHGVKAARRSGTPLAISKQRAPSPRAESGEGFISPEDPTSRPFWPAADDDKQAMDLERSRSRGIEQRPCSHQSNISSLVSGTPKQREYERRSLSGASNHSIESINAFIRTPPDPMRSASGMSNRSSGTPPLRRADRSVSSDLRGANRMSEAKKRAKQPAAEVDTSIPIPASSSPTTHDDSNTDQNKSRVKQMADVFEAYGDFHGSPLSPTRPPSVRRRQSMQLLELESRNDRLAAENRQLLEAKSRAERDLEDAAHDRSQEISSYHEGIETRETWLRQKDTELTQLKETIESLQHHVAHLTEVNQGLQPSSRGLDEHEEKYGQLQVEHADTHQRWQQSTRELEDLRQQHAHLSAGMEDIVRHEVTIAVEEKNLELRRIQDELSAAKDQIRTLQQQILASKRSDSSSSLLDRDEDYFDTQCQSLCQHVQQWVLRFSKFSDSRACYLASEIRDEKIVDRMENAILDGSDVDAYLADRVKRRDVFMSMVMTMTWEFIFTRYLFGADREQRQKLKSLEKTLSESASTSAVHKWRATTLHLLSKREAFKSQRAQDTEAVMHTIYETLATILPPPGHLIPQIQTSLTKVLAIAADLSIEMRTQRFEYVMLPPLQPEYDTNGDLARKVYFNAALMNERGGGGTSNEELERQEAVVRMVLFPLVVRKGDAGDGEEEGAEEIVVCPAQVLTAEAERRRGKVRVVSAQGSRAGDFDMGNMF